MDQFKEKFLEEGFELLGKLEGAMLQLENSQDDPSIIQNIFRIMHTLKGNSAMFGYERVNEFTHHLETIYDLIRNNEMEISKDILNITFKSVDHINGLLEYENDLPSPLNEEHQKLMNDVIKMASPNGNERENPQANQQEDTSEKDAETESICSYYIYFEPKADILKYGTNPLFLIDDLIQLGKALVYPKTHKIPSLDQINAEECFISWEIILETKEPENDIKDIFIFVEDECTLDVQKISDKSIITPDFEKEISIIGLSEQHIDADKIKDLLSVDSEEPEKKKKKKSLKDKIKEAGKKADRTPVKGKKETAISSIRVSSDKLDQLLNLVSEMVTIQARMSLYADENGLAELQGITENMEKISRRLRDTAFNICLIPLESMLTRFQRLVRDVSNELGKEVQFITEGAETELDKTIIESLADPIMHILRNSLDHGLESTADRIKAEKPEQGTIRLKAYYSGTHVYIEISDDGKGIDYRKIREKAIEKAVITGEEPLSQKEIVELIFAPGFSTAETVTGLSGRGVGMDVVKRKIAEIRGEVDIETEVGKGTTITIRLPLTLSIIDGLLVDIGNTAYIIPLTVINNIFATERKKLKGYNGLVNHDGEEIPFVNLHSEFENQDENTQDAQLVVVNYNDYKVGLVVDAIVGEYQAVLKPIGKLFKDQDFVSGATILGDGSIALVLDTSRIIKEYIQELK